MSNDFGSKKTFADNLSFYVERSGRTQKELADLLGVATSTFNNWITGKKYPRMDKVEMLANYFGIQKSDLIEERLTEEMEKDNDMLADIIVRMRMDEGFRNLVKLEYGFDSAKIEAIYQMLHTFK